MCCGGRMCMMCTCVILVVVLIGLLFGFGVFKDGFHKLEDTVHDINHLQQQQDHDFHSRPFLKGGFLAPPPLF